jgi:hypothetical protein
MHTPFTGFILRPGLSQRAETSSLSCGEGLAVERIALEYSLVVVGVWCSILVRCDMGSQLNYICCRIIDPNKSIANGDRLISS